MTHSNAPLSMQGGRRLLERYRTRPIAHVAAEMGISRACASKWVNRWRSFGEADLQDRSSVPHRSPKATPDWVVACAQYHPDVFVLAMWEIRDEFGLLDNVHGRGARVLLLLEDAEIVDSARCRFVRTVS